METKETTQHDDDFVQKKNDKVVEERCELDYE